MLHEGVRGGSRPDYLLSRYLPMAAVMAPLFEATQRAGRLRQFDEASMVPVRADRWRGAIPLPALSAGVLGDLLEPGTPAAQRHIDRLLDVLFGRGTH